MRQFGWEVICFLSLRINISLASLSEMRLILPEGPQSEWRPGVQLVGRGVPVVPLMPKSHRLGHGV